MAPIVDHMPRHGGAAHATAATAVSTAAAGLASAAPYAAGAASVAASALSRAIPRDARFAGRIANGAGVRVVVPALCFAGAAALTGPACSAPPCRLSAAFGACAATRRGPFVQLFDSEQAAASREREQ